MITETNGKRLTKMVLSSCNSTQYMNFHSNFEQMVHNKDVYLRQDS